MKAELVDGPDLAEQSNVKAAAVVATVVAVKMAAESMLGTSKTAVAAMTISAATAAAEVASVRMEASAMWLRLVDDCYSCCCWRAYWPTIADPFRRVSLARSRWWSAFLLLMSVDQVFSKVSMLAL